MSCDSTGCDKSVKVVESVLSDTAEWAGLLKINTKIVTMSLNGVFSLMKENQKPSPKKKAARAAKKRARVAKKQASHQKPNLLRDRLKKLKDSGPELGIEQLVNRANRIVKNNPGLFQGDSDGRVAEEITKRNIRNYQNREMISAPSRDGKKAVYGFTHLLQLLAIRRGLALGNRGRQLKTMVDGLGEKQLMQLLFADSQTKPAKQKSADEPTASGPWIRVTIVPGLELHAARGFTVPAGPGKKELMQRFGAALREVRKIRKELSARFAQNSAKGKKA